MIFRLANGLIHLVGVGATAFAMARMAHDPLGWLNPFSLWAWAPYVLLAFAAMRAKSRPFKLGTLLSSLAVTALGTFAYLSVALHPSDAQDGLVFLEIPLAQLLLAMVGLGAGKIVARRQQARNQPPSTPG
jgi:hypothetical protein